MSQNREPRGDEVWWPIPESQRAIDDALYHGGEPDYEDDDMPCPAAGGVQCGADDCLKNGCIEQREAGE